MILTPELIAAYKKMITNPKEHKLEFESLDEIFEKSEIAIAKHLIYDSYLLRIKKPVPKVVFYIIMDEMFESKIADDLHLGYCVKFKN